MSVWVLVAVLMAPGLSGRLDVFPTLAICNSVRDRVLGSGDFPPPAIRRVPGMIYGLSCVEVKLESPDEEAGCRPGPGERCASAAG